MIEIIWTITCAIAVLGMLGLFGYCIIKMIRSL